MKSNFFALTFAIILIISFMNSGFALGKEITWLTADFPPFSIVDGPYEGSGNLEFIKSKITESLKEYTHKKLVANPKRIFHEMKYRDRRIYATAAKTVEREKFVLYSVPYVIVFPNHLISLEKNYPLIKPYLKEDKFTFDMALENERLTIGYAIGRQYGKNINRLINKHVKKEKLKVNYDDYFKQSFVDLLNGRVDSVIGLPNESEYFLRILKSDKKVVEYPFEGEEKYFTGYIVLSKTKWGEKTLKLINRVLIKYRNTEAFHRRYERWLSKKNRVIYRRYVKEFYKED